MKTTLLLDDAVARRLKREAAREGKSMSAVVTEALRERFRRRSARRRLRPLPNFEGGAYLVEVSDREALDRVFDADR